MVGQPHDVIQLVIQLEELGVTLPETIRSSADQLARIHGLRPKATLPEDLVGLSDDELTTVIRDFGVAIVLDGPMGDDALDRTRGTLAFAIAGELLHLADDIIDQLRPAFDAAAALVHHATTLGINPRTTDRDVLRHPDVAASRDAWASLPAASGALSAAATARMLLSTATGAPPRAPQRISGVRNNGGGIEEVAGAMFRDDGRPFHEEFEDNWQTWLRLSAGSPVRLLSLAETVAVLKPKPVPRTSLAVKPVSAA